MLSFLLTRYEMVSKILALELKTDKQEIKVTLINSIIIINVLGELVRFGRIQLHLLASNKKYIFIFEIFENN